jgi:hypothetical protein
VKNVQQHTCLHLQSNNTSIARIPHYLMSSNCTHWHHQSLYLQAGKDRVLQKPGTTTHHHADSRSKNQTKVNIQRVLTCSSKTGSVSHSVLQLQYTITVNTAVLKYLFNKISSQLWSIQIVIRLTCRGWQLILPTDIGLYNICNKVEPPLKICLCKKLLIQQIKKI